MNLKSPAFWFRLAVLVLGFIYITTVVRSSDFPMPPLPIGDGMDYENIAFQLYTGQGFRIDTSSAEWRSLYATGWLNDQLSMLGGPSLWQLHDYELHLKAPVRSLASTGRPPLLPTIIAGIYCCVGRNIIAFEIVRLFSALCLVFSGAMATAVTAHLLRRCAYTATVVVGASATLLLAASSRTLIGYAMDFLTEPLALALTQFLIVLVVFRLDPTEGPEKRSANTWAYWGFCIGEGVLLAGMILTRSLFVLWLPGVWILLTLSRPGALVGRCLASSVSVGIAVLLCMPWWVHNVYVLKRFMPLGTQGPITLIGGYSDEAMAAGGDWQFAPEQRLRARLAMQPSFVALANGTEREVAVATAAKEELKEWVWEHRFELPKLALLRIITHWNPYHGRSLVWKLLILLGLIWLVAQRGSVNWWFIGLPLLSTALAAVLYTTGGRFLVPLYGMLFTLGGLGCGGVACVLLERLRGRDTDNQQAY